MRNLFDDLEENLKKTFNTSPKESFDDLGLDEEERDKIVHNISGSGLSDLNVDYSNFENHIFFGSAYAAANFALSRIIRDYPIDGELKEKNEWKKTNTGYENWFFDNFPKQQGYTFLVSGTSHSFIKTTDYEGKLSYGTGSNGLNTGFTVEFVIKPYTNMVASQVYPVFSFIKSNATQGLYSYITNGASGKTISLTVANPSDSRVITASLDTNFSQSTHVAFSCDGTSLYSFVNGELQMTQSLTSMTAAVDLGGETLYLGFLSSTAGYYYYSGSIDDFRYWTKYRSPELIKRNYFRAINANHSGALALYWKFNEPPEYGNKVVDYSGNALHGELSGTSFSVATNIVSGTLGSWFKDGGDPILALENSRVNSFIEEQRTSGSLYDDENQNMIFNLVPEHFIDGDDTEYQQLFLLLTARHFDRLKLYIEHLSNITKSKTAKYDGTPSNLLDVAAKHYGLDIGGIYSSADPLQNFFGENVYTTGSLDITIDQIRTTLKRNIFSNMNYLLKSKSTQQAIKGLLHAIGLNDNIVSINEYSDFSGGIKTTFTPKTVERRVAQFLTSSNIYVTSSSGVDHSAFTEAQTWQTRFMFKTGSAYLTQSVFSFMSGTNYLYNISVERENISSSYGKLRFKNTTTDATSSLLQVWNNNWNNFSMVFIPDFDEIDYFVSSIDRAGLNFTHSATVSVVPQYRPSYVVLGSSGTAYFDGYMQEFRKWSGKSFDIWETWLPRFERWAYDWELLELANPITDYSKLDCHLKLDDFTGSETGGGPIHNYAHGLSGSSYLGFSSSADYNFPGKYIDKFDIAYTYDLNIDNDKIRIRNGSEFTDNDQNWDVPFVSIDFSPITSLNKEIMKWMGNLERFSNIVSDPLYQYRDASVELDAIRSAFFRERVNSRIDYAAFANLIKWFDNNFTFLLSQFIPLDMASSISNYVIEPHILEYNKVKKYAGLGPSGKTSNLEATVTVLPQLTASSGYGLGVADPGRYGAFVSASAEVSKDVYFRYTSSSLGINYETPLVRKIVDNVLRDDLEKNSPDGYGNGFITKIITGSNYLKNTLNINPNFVVSGIYYSGSGDLGTKYLSSSHGAPANQWTGSFNGYQDARWLWMGPVSGSPPTIDVLRYTTYYMINYGIGYGGMWGQLHIRSNRAFSGYPLRPSGGTDMPAPYIGGVDGGPSATGIQLPKIDYTYIKTYTGDKLKTYIAWPKSDTFDGSRIVYNTSSIVLDTGAPAAGFGNVIDIEGYSKMNFELLAKTSQFSSSNANIQFNFSIKFQFFSFELPGDRGFENVMSSSFENGTFVNKGMEASHILRTEQLPTNTALNFVLNFERDLQKQKYMRLHITPTMYNTTYPNNVDTGSFGSMNVLTKVILSKEEG